jgi:hypothetical protein
MTRSASVAHATSSPSTGTGAPVHDRAHLHLPGGRGPIDAHRIPDILGPG